MSVYCELVGTNNHPVCYRSKKSGLEKEYAFTYTDIPSPLLFAYEMLLLPLAGWSPVLERNKYMSFGITMSARLDKKQVEQLLSLKEAHIPEMAIASTKDCTEIFLPSRVNREKAAAFLASAIFLMRGESAPKFHESLDGAPALCHMLLTSGDSDLPLPFRAARREQLGQDVFVIRFHAVYASAKQYDGWLEEHYSLFGERNPARNEMYIAVSKKVLQAFLGNMFAFAAELRENVTVAARLFTEEESKSRSWWRHVAYRALCMSIPEAWAATDPVLCPAFSLEV